MAVDQIGQPLTDQWDERDVFAPPDTGRLYRIRREDQIAEVWPADYTPKKIRSILNAAATGDPGPQDEAFDAMLESDPTLSGVYATRLNAITNRQWEVVPASEVMPSGTMDETLAAATADYCRMQLAGIPAIDDVLAHLADAIGRSTAIAEIVWRPEGKAHVVSSIVPVSMRAVNGDPICPWLPRVRTRENAYPGVMVSETPNKWIVHTPRIIAGNPFRGGTHRICLILHIIRRYGFQWWASNLELFGQPYRKATYPKAANAETKTQIENSLKNFGHAGWGVFPPEVEFELIEAMKGAETWPHQTLLDHIDGRYAVLLLGQTLTTDAGDRGTQALGTVHEHVRADVRDADIRAESATIRRDLLTPMVRLGPFPPDAPVPCFRRVVEELTDQIKQVDVFDAAVNRLGMQVKAGYAYAKLDIPIPDGVDPESPLDGAPQPAFDPFAPIADPDEDEEDADDPPQRKAATRRKHRAAAAVPKVPTGNAKPAPTAVLATWITHAVDEARRQVRAVAAHCVDAVGDSRDGRNAIIRLQECIARLPSESFGGAIADYMLACSLAGAYVGQRRIESRRKHKADDKGKAPPEWESHEAFGRPFRAAIDALSERVAMSPDNFLRLERAARSRAARIAGEFNLRIVQDVYGTIADTMEQGEGVQSFLDGIRQVPQLDGWTGANPWHAKLVFEQNANMSYGAGQYAAMQDAGLELWRFRTYLAVDEDNPCAICRPFDGKVFASTDRALYPPVHFSCKCYADPVFDGEVTPDQVTRAADVRNPEYDAAMRGRNAFKYDPAQFARQEPLDLAPVPHDLRREFASYARSHGWETR